MSRPTAPGAAEPTTSRSAGGDVRLTSVDDVRCGSRATNTRRCRDAATATGRCHSHELQHRRLRALARLAQSTESDAAIAATVGLDELEVARLRRRLDGVGGRGVGS